MLLKIQLTFSELVDKLPDGVERGQVTPDALNPPVPRGVNDLVLGLHALAHVAARQHHAGAAPRQLRRRRLAEARVAARHHHRLAVQLLVARVQVAREVGARHCHAADHRAHRAERVEVTPQAEIVSAAETHLQPI